MKVAVDQQTCIGCELCTSAYPDLFKMDGDKAVIISSDVPPKFEDDAAKAKDECPVGAINVE